MKTRATKILGASLLLNLAILVFHAHAAQMAQEAYLKASNTDANDRFGFWVAVSVDTVWSARR
jgi:FG-GAP repeat protein